MHGSKRTAWLAREKWFVLACALLVLNLYGVLRQPAAPSAAPSPAGASPAVAAPPPEASDGTPRVEHASSRSAAAVARERAFRQLAERPVPGPAPDAAWPRTGGQETGRTFAITGIQAQSPPFGDALIRLQLSHRVEAAALRRAITLDPPAEFSVDLHPEYGQRQRAELRGGIVRGARYTITIKGTLATADGSATLGSDLTRVIAVPDAQPQARIAKQGRYLSPEGALHLPLQSINVERYTLRATRIPVHNLVQYAMREGRHYSGFHGRPDAGIGTLSTNRTFTIATEHNTLAEHSAPLRELLPANPRGAYVIDLMLERRIGDTRLLVVTDTGISARLSAHELQVWANAIHSLEAVAGATVKAWSSAAELLAEGRTDHNGLACLALATHGDVQPFMVTVETDDDLSFLDLTAARLPASPGAAAQDYLAGGHEAFLHTDRGVYRPAETARVRGIVRGSHLALPEAFPVDLDILRPDGRRHSRRSATLSPYGTVEFAVPWTDFDATGRYTLELKTPGSETALGATTVALEEFAPPVISVRAQPDQPRYLAGESGRLSAAALHLYGPPASGSPASARLTAVPTPFTSPHFPDHAFGDAQRTMAETTLQLGRGHLDADGAGVFDFTIPRTWRPPSMLRGVLGVTVLDQGGRPVSAHAECEIHPHPMHIGLRAPGIQALRPGDAARIEIALVHPDGSPLRASRRLDASLHSVRWSAVTTQDANGRWRYQSERTFNEAWKQPLQTDADGHATFAVTPGAGGSHLLRVDDPDSGAATSLEFFVGGEHERWQNRSMEQPGRLQLQLDKPRHRPGDVALLSVVAPFPGKALLTVEQDRVLHSAVQTFPSNSGTFAIPVDTRFWPNAHLSVTLIREVQPGDLQQIYRATGTLPLRMDASEHRLQVHIDAPETLRPGSPLQADIRITGADGRGRTAEFTLAAVDEGICLLTDFQTPDPLGFFTALRRNGVVSADLYAMLLAETESELVSQRSHTGGDMARALRGRLNPVRSRRFTPLALWQGAGLTDPDGAARVRLDIPEFSGQVRLMVVAVDEDRFGSAHRRVTVRRPLTVIPFLPRFLAPGDTTTLTVELHNNGEEDATVQLAVTTDGPVDLAPHDDAPIHLPRGQRVTRHIRLQAREAAGVARISLNAELGADAYAETIELPVRPAAPRTTRFGTVVVPPGASRDVTLPGGWLEGTARFGLQLSERPAVRFKGALEYLLRYPHGCLEQTVSTAFPLLYLADLHELFDSRVQVGDVSPMVEAGITRVVSMQLHDGRFGYWPNTRNAYDWGSVYALEFLVEAREAGHAVPAGTLEAGADALRRMLARPVRGGADVGSEEWQADASLRAHACHVLARAGQPRHDWSARLLEQAGFLDEDTHLRLVMALAAGGRRRDAWNTLQSVGQRPRADPPTRQTGDSLVSPARTAALRLEAFSELAPDDPRTLAALHKLETLMENGAWHTTQENAMALRALARHLQQTPATDKGYRGHLERNGVRTPFASGEPTDLAGIVGEGGLTLFNAGPGPLVAVWQAAGIPLGHDHQDTDHRDTDHQNTDRRVTIRRAWLDLDGRELEALRARQGELRVVRLSVDTQGERLDNLVIEELLPAGLEVENAALRTSETVRWAAQGTTLPVRHTDVRDDRLVVFAEAFSGRRTFHYVVRAVSPGRYALPQTSVEAMYDPSIASRSGGGTFEVEP